MYNNSNVNANLQVNKTDASALNPVPVSGPLTDTELRATDIPVTLDGEPIALPAVASAVKISPTGGSKTVTTAGTAEALVASSTLRTMLYVRAKSTNTGDVYLGDSSVDKTTSQQIVLGASQEITIEAPAGYCLDINEFYLDAATDGEGVDFLYV